MGEKIRTLSKGKIQGEDVEIELNFAHSIDQPRDIHIQTAKARFQLNELEYARLAISIISAKRRLLAMKKLTSNE